MANAPGMVATVQAPGRGDWFGAIGVTDAETKTPICFGERARIGSVTKSFTAALVLQLADDGVWQVSDAIHDWLPEWNIDPQITLEMLLNHTSGLFNFTDDLGFLGLMYDDATPEEVVAFSLRHDAVAPPGAVFYYSNTNFFLLGLALERATGIPYHQLVRDRLLAPLGLDMTFVEGLELGLCPCGRGHLLGSATAADGFNMTWAWAAGGIVSTVDDICRWLGALYGGAVLSQTWVDRMTIPTAQSVAVEESYGLATKVLERSGLVLWGHTGSVMGFNGEAFFEPLSRACVVVQTNDFVGEPEPAAQFLWAIVASP